MGSNETSNRKAGKIFGMEGTVATCVMKRRSQKEEMHKGNTERNMVVSVGS